MDALMRSEPPICALTGERGSGKSTVCTRVAGEAQRRGCTVAGIVTQRVETDQCSSRVVVDLGSGESRSFAWRRPKNRDGATGRRPSISRSHQTRHDVQGRPAESLGAGRNTVSDSLTPGWEYDPEVFTWVNEALVFSTAVDLLIVDEVGPLELLGGRGWVKILDVLRLGEFPAALVVCRPELLAELAQRLGRAPSRVFEVTAQNRDALPNMIAEDLLGKGGPV